MASSAEGYYTAEFLMSEENGTRSRDLGVIVSGQGVLPGGQVLGKVSVATTAAAVALGTNTGNGTFGTITVGAPAIAGAYTVRMQDATHFVLEDPNGREVGHGTTGVAFSSAGIGFTLTAGGTAFLPGDSFTVTPNANANAGKWVAYDPSAADGSEVAAGILYGKTDATSADAACVVMARGYEAKLSAVTFKNGGQAAATIALAALGIIFR